MWLGTNNSFGMSHELTSIRANIFPACFLSLGMNAFALEKETCILETYQKYLNTAPSPRLAFPAPPPTSLLTFA